MTQFVLPGKVATSRRPSEHYAYDFFAEQIGKDESRDMLARWQALMHRSTCMTCRSMLLWCSRTTTRQWLNVLENVFGNFSLCNNSNCCVLRCCSRSSSTPLCLARLLLATREEVGMEYRTFGRLGWQVSEIGYGMWGMGG